ncbi:hypothetical protein QZH41_009347, partial [Actinostola sp. cb2023]
NEMTLHMYHCVTRQRKCGVDGCCYWGTQVDMQDHMKLCAENHVKLLQSNKEKLTNAILEKNTADLVIKEDCIDSFLWAIHDFKVSVLANTSESTPFTSPEFQAHGAKWRLLLFPGRKWEVFLQLTSSFIPFRIVTRYIPFFI